MGIINKNILNETQKKTSNILKKALLYSIENLPNKKMDKNNTKCKK